MFLDNIFDGLLYLIFFPDITRAAIDFFVSSLFSEAFDGFIDVIDLSADNIDCGSMLKEVFGNTITDASGTTADQDHFAFEKFRTEDRGHLIFIFFIMFYDIMGVLDMGSLQLPRLQVTFDA